MYKMGWDNMISTVARRGSLKLMACDGQLLAQICCSHLFCFNSLKCSHLDRNKHVKRSCVHHELLTLTFVESLGTLLFTGAYSLQLHSQWPKRLAELSAGKMLWHASRGWINDSVKPNLVLINAVLHLGKVACQCTKNQWVIFKSSLPLKWH